MNGDNGKSLTDGQRAIIDMACGDANIWSMGRAEASQCEAIAFHKSKGVNIHQRPAETIEKFRQAWEEVAQEQAASHPDCKQSYEAHSAFRGKYRPWKALGWLQ